MQNSCLQLFKQVYDDANKWIDTSPCAHAHSWAQCINYMGMGAPVTHVVSGHRALKKQLNNDIEVSLEPFKHALQILVLLTNYQVLLIW